MSRVSVQEPGLWLQSLNLMMSDPDPDEGWRIQASADGISWGQLEPVINAIASQLSDGDIEDISRFDNRSVTIQLRIDAASNPEPGVAVARGQRALELACRWSGWGTLRWRSPLAGAPVNVMEVLWAVPQRESDNFDVEEILRGERVITLTLRVRPFVRPELPVTLTAPPLPPDPDVPLEDLTVLDGSASSLAALTPVPFVLAPSAIAGGATVSVQELSDSGLAWVFQHFNGGPRPYYANPYCQLRVAPAGGFVFDPDRPYLRIRGKAYWTDDWANLTYGWPEVLNVSMSVGGSVKVLSNGPVGTDGSWEILLSGTGTLLGFDLFEDWGPLSGPRPVWAAAIGIDNATLIATPQEGVFTGKAQSRLVPIDGSQRTELSLSVLGLDTDGQPVPLGEQVLVYSASTPADDDTRAKFVSARLLSELPGTPDATAVSGIYSEVGTTSAPTSFELAATGLLPGDFALYPRLMALTAGDHALSYRVTIESPDGTQQITGPWTERRITAGTDPWPVIPEDVWRIVPLGIADMLIDALPGGTITLQLAAEAGVFRVDDVFLANVLGQATLVDTTKSGGTLSKVTVDASTLTRPYPSVWVGEVDGAMTDAARGGRLLAGGEEHQAIPRQLLIATVTPGCATSRLSGVYYPRSGWDVPGDFSAGGEVG